MKFFIFFYIFIILIPRNLYADINHNRQKYLVAKELLAQNLYGMAYEKLEEISKDYELYDYVLLDKSFCLVKVGEDKKALEVLDNIIREYKGYPVSKKAYKNLISLVKDFDKKLKVIDEYLNYYPDDREVIFEKALLLKKINRKEAKNLFKKLFLEGGSKTIASYKEVENELTKEEIYQTSLKLLKNNDFQVIDLIKNLEKKNSLGNVG
jgi:tetratricopeptide (TPR) repeat protein